MTIHIAMQAMLDWKIRAHRAGARSKEAKMAFQRFDGLIIEPEERELVAQFERQIIEILRSHDLILEMQRNECTCGANRMMHE